MSALLTARGLRKLHGERLVFDIADLALEQGRAYVLTGVNGSGKSTLLRALAGLERVECFAFEWEGKAVPLHPYPQLLREALVYVHQHPIMFSTTVAQNVAYGLLARGMPRKRALALAAQAMEWAGVSHLASTQPARLSGGEKQRVALARARVMQPRLLLLDEPTANLDGAAREQVIALIPTLVAEGSTIVMACHDRDLINLPGVQRIKLRDGQLEYK